MAPGAEPFGIVKCELRTGHEPKETTTKAAKESFPHIARYVENTT